MFSAGACLPLIPYVFGDASHGILIASLISGTALFCVGAALSLFSGRNAFLGRARGDLEASTQAVVNVSGDVKSLKQAAK